MKKLYLILFIVFISSAAVFAQSALTFNASHNYTDFRFKGSDGVSQNKEYKGIFSPSYGIGYQYTFDFGLILRGGLGMRNTGAYLVYDDSKYSWNLKYADVNIGAGYKYKFDRISPYIMVSGYFGYMLDGTQILNNEIFSITQNQTMKRTDIGMIFSPGGEFSFTDNLSATLEFNYLMGLKNLETVDTQKTCNNSMGFSLGLIFTFTKSVNSPRI